MLKNLLMSLAVAATFALPYATEGMAAEMGFVPQTSDQREIKVTATPRGLSHQAKTWDFEVVLESHTQALNDDLAKSSILIAEGKQYLPLRWEGAPPGGHHRKGVLHFKTIVPQPRALELQVRLAGDGAPRSFRWQLK